MILIAIPIPMERIHVSVRAKPLSQDEAKTSPWRISGNSISIPNLSKFEFGIFFSLSLFSSWESLSYPNFRFVDQIFSENCATAQVFEARTKDIVEAAVRGFNGLQAIMLFALLLLSLLLISWILLT